MILHFFPASQAFTEPWIQYLKKWFPDEEHWVIVHGCPQADAAKYEAHGNVVCLVEGQWQKKLRAIVSLLNKSDVVVMHYVTLGLAPLFRIKPSWLKKLRLTCWGGDVELLRRPPQGGLRARTRWQRLKTELCWLLRHAVKVGFLIEADRQWVTQAVPGIKEPCLVGYGLIERMGELESEELYRKPRPYRVLLGNSATETNGHEEILRKLAAYRDEDFVCYVPLAYGDAAYAERVTALGRELLGEKLIPLTEFVPLEEYNRLLYSMTVVIQNHRRQQALGNIHVAFLGRCKVYFHPGSPCEQEFSRYGYTTFSTEEIGRVPFEAFVAGGAYLDRNRELKLEENAGFYANVENWRRFMH